LISTFGEGLRNGLQGLIVEVMETPNSVKGKLDLDVYTVSDLHERLGFKRQTIQKWIRDGQLRAVNFGGSAGNIVMKEWLMEFINKRAGGNGHTDLPLTTAE
jgi:excisionase family DNA binding protein